MYSTSHVTQRLDVQAFNLSVLNAASLSSFPEPNRSEQQSPLFRLSALLLAGSKPKTDEALMSTENAFFS